MDSSAVALQTHSPSKQIATRLNNASDSKIGHMSNVHGTPMNAGMIQRCLSVILWLLNTYQQGALRTLVSEFHRSNGLHLLMLQNTQTICLVQ